MSKSRIELLNADPIIKFIEKIFIEEFDYTDREKGVIKKTRDKTPQGLNLIGGAVIDILEGRKPKDYDFIGGGTLFTDKLLANGFKFECKTKTATTYKKGKTIIQILAISPQHFEYVISQAAFKLKAKKLEIDEISFKNKTLIPVSFDSMSQVKAALVRIPHWQNKGYSIHDKTYLSLLNAVLNVKSQRGS